MLREMLVFLWIMAIGCCCLAHKDGKGMEKFVTQQIHIFQKEIQNSPPVRRRPLLIATILNGSNPESVKTMHKNLAKVQDVSYDFAAIFYDGGIQAIHSVCHKNNFNRIIVHCKRALASFTFPNHTIPKPFLYAELSPYLRNYEKLILLDEDILYTGVKLKEYLQIWDCAFYPSHPPLLVQGLVSGSSVVYEYLNWGPWKNNTPSNVSEVVAAGLDLIEMQSPGIDALFFLWFNTYVLPWTLSEYAKGQTSWGFDYFWCGAARTFAKVYYKVDVEKRINGGETYDYAPCALVMGSSLFTHLDGRTIAVKHQSDAAFSGHYVEGFKRIYYWASLFPHWFTKKSNPLRTRTYKKARKLPQACRPKL